MTLGFINPWYDSAGDAASHPVRPPAVKLLPLDHQTNPVHPASSLSSARDRNPS